MKKYPFFSYLARIERRYYYINNDIFEWNRDICFESSKERLSFVKCRFDHIKKDLIKMKKSLEFDKDNSTYFRRNKLYFFWKNQVEILKNEYEEFFIKVPICKPKWRCRKFHDCEYIKKENKKFKKIFDFGNDINLKTSVNWDV